MKDFIGKHKSHLVHLLFTVIFAAVLVCFNYLKRSRGLMNSWTMNIMTPVRQNIASFFSFLPITFAEILWALGILLLVILLILFIVKIIKKKWSSLIHTFIFTVNTILVIVILAHATWGAYYYADGFCEQSGIYPQQCTVSQLFALTKYFAHRANIACTRTERNPDGTLALTWEEVLEGSGDKLDPMLDEFPFLDGMKIDAKPMVSSELWSWMNTTGITFPYTGECLINIRQPICFMPSTVTHELSHQRGICSEQEANFIAILSCIRSDDPNYVYSGYLMGYIHLSNALYSVNYDSWAGLYNALSSNVKADLRANSAYWQAHTSKVSEAHDKLYDSYLRNYGDELGMQSYGAVVDLLISYYSDKDIS